MLLLSPDLKVQNVSRDAFMVMQTGLQPVTYVGVEHNSNTNERQQMNVSRCFIVPSSCSYGKLDECLSLICWLFSLEMGKLCYFHFLNLLYLFKVFMCTIQIHIYMCPRNNDCNKWQSLRLVLFISVQRRQCFDTAKARLF